jgi:predicted dehydrogenase
MNVVVAGLGTIGRRHLANLQAIAPDVRPIVWRHRQPSCPEDAHLAQNPTVYSLSDVLEHRPDAALVTGPATCHVETSLALARHGVHVFVEKPLSATLDGVDELISVCRDRRGVLTVGYCFRFYRPLQSLRRAILDGAIGRPMSIRAEAGRYLPEWRPSGDYREMVSASRSLGGGVLLELSHELDYVQWLLGSIGSVSAHLGRLSDLDIDVEDTAELLLEFSSGAVGSVHLDMTQRSPVRGCRIVGTEGTLVWNGATHGARLYTAASGAWCDLHAADTTAYEDMYRLELRDFLDAVGGAPLGGATAEEGRRVIEVVLAARQSSEERRTVVM